MAALRTLAVLTACSMVIASGTLAQPPVPPEAPQTPAKTTEPQAGEPKAADAKTADPKTVAPVPSVVKLLDAGQEPRKVLRLAPDAKAEQSLQVTMDMQSSMKLDGNPMPTPKSPLLQMTMGVRIAEMLSGGDARYAMTLNKAEAIGAEGVEPEFVGQMTEAVSKAAGSSGTSIVDPRWQSRENTVKLPDGSDPRLEQIIRGLQTSLQQMSPPMPEEAVGAGAKWEVVLSGMVNGLNQEMRTTFTLVSMDEREIRVKMDFVQSGELGKVELDGAPGVDAELTAFSGKGTGEAVMQLDRVAPLSGTMEMNTITTITVSQEGQKKLMSQDTTIKTMLAPAKP